MERHEGQCWAATIQLNHPAYFWEAVVVKFDSFSWVGWTQIITDKSKGINLAIMLTALCFFRYPIVYILKVPRFHFISHSDIHIHKANLTSGIVWKLCYFRNQYTTGNTFLCISIEKVGVSRERMRTCYVLLQLQSLNPFQYSYSFAYYQSHSWIHLHFYRFINRLDKLSGRIVIIVEALITLGGNAIPWPFISHCHLPYVSLSCQLPARTLFTQR